MIIVYARDRYLITKIINDESFNQVKKEKKKKAKKDNVQYT